MSKVRVGCVGTGIICDLVHLPALKSDDRVDLVALCGRNHGRTQQVADKHGIASTYSDYRDMIAKAGLDAIVIASPDDLHYEMAMAALDAGLHLLCEKPLALNECALAFLHEISCAHASTPYISTCTPAFS